MFVFCTVLLYSPGSHAADVPRCGMCAQCYRCVGPVDSFGECCGTCVEDNSHPSCGGSCLGCPDGTFPLPPLCECPTALVCNPDQYITGGGGGLGEKPATCTNCPTAPDASCTVLSDGVQTQPLYANTVCYLKANTCNLSDATGSFTYVSDCSYSN